ncbi:MAG: SprB repeat-containing protein [Bacteroidetes bacterium]|nr:SprB repeat-containing protein [Bacteroidota bacterium]
MNNISGLSIQVANTSSACFANNGSISLTGTGGIAPLQYSINGTIYQSSAVFTGLAGGTYTVYVKRRQWMYSNCHNNYFYCSRPLHQCHSFQCVMWRE